jgi:HEPN domain-containing protein
MEVRAGTDADHERMHEFRALLKELLGRVVQPGEESIVTTALIWTTGEVLQGVPDPYKGQVIEFYQDQLAKVARARSAPPR